MSSTKWNNGFASRLDLPLFLTSRNPLKPNIAEKVVKQVQKHANFYIPQCPKELPARQTHSHSHWNDPEIKGDLLKPCTPLKLSGRVTVTRDDWKMAPCRYDPISEPFRYKKGMFGAYWTPLKVPTIFAKETKRLTPFIKTTCGRSCKPPRRYCNAHKGKFFRTAHDQPPTSRFGVIYANNSHQNPDEPGPNYYKPKPVTGYRIDYKKSYTPEKIYNSHKFHQQSYCPITARFWCSEFSGYRQDPFRYESRYADGCSCPRNKLYDPNYRLHLERDQRLKFRNIRHKRYAKEKFCDPQWKHVIGKGHCHVFMGGKQPKSLKSSSQKKKQQQERDHGRGTKSKRMPINRNKYVAHLNAIAAKVESNPSGRLPRRRTVVKFNVGRKMVIRKHLHNDKKIAFGRSIDSLIKTGTLTKTELNKIKMRLPEDRRLMDHPVMNTPIKEITPRYLEKSKQKPRLLNIKANRRVFRFDSLPKPKHLLEPFDVHPPLLDNIGYYHIKLNIYDYV